MPRMKLNFLPYHVFWTKVPNHLIQTLMPLLSDTELRLLLILLRRTAGYGRPSATVMLSYRTLMELTGRSSATVVKALKSLRAKGLVHSASPKLDQILGCGVSKSDHQQYKERE